MSDLYHVIYSGTVGIDQNNVIEESMYELKKQIGSIRNIKETKVIYVDHPADIEDVINSLDDRDIPCTDIFDDVAGLYLITSFVLKGVDKTNPELVALFDRVKSN